MQRVACPNNGSCTHRMMLHKRYWISTFFTSNKTKSLGERVHAEISRLGMESEACGEEQMDARSPSSRKTSLFCHRVGRQAWASLDHYAKPPWHIFYPRCQTRVLLSVKTMFQGKHMATPVSSSQAALSQVQHSWCKYLSPSCISALPNNCVHSTTAARQMQHGKNVAATPTNETWKNDTVPILRHKAALPGEAGTCE